MAFHHVAFATRDLEETTTCSILLSPGAADLIAERLRDRL